jgi:hypothetical protein
VAGRRCACASTRPTLEPVTRWWVEALIAEADAPQLAGAIVVAIQLDLHLRRRSAADRARRGQRVRIRLEIYGVARELLWSEPRIAVRAIP